MRWAALGGAAVQLGLPRLGWKGGPAAWESVPRARAQSPHLKRAAQLMPRSVSKASRLLNSSLQQGMRGDAGRREAQ